MVVRQLDVSMNTSPAETVTRSVKVEDQEGVGFLFRVRLLFYLGTNDSGQGIGREAGANNAYNC